MNAHIKYEHLLDINKYYNQYHNVNFTKENYQFNGKDVFFILQIRELFPQFNNDTEILQYIYDTNEYCFDTISKIYDIKNINQLCYNFNIKINYDLSEYHKRRISEGSIGKVLSKEHKQAISDGINNIPLERKKKIYKQISEANKGKVLLL